MTSREELADGERYLLKGRSAARSAARRCKDTAMERRGAQVLRVMENRAPQGAIQKERLAALQPLGLSRGRKGKTA